MTLGPNRVVFQAQIGSKQSRPNHSSPVVSLDRVPDPRICPVDHIRTYLAQTADKRSSTRLFITMTPLHGQASIQSLRTLLVRTLKEAGIAFPAGYTRAVAASFALAHRVSINIILICRYCEGISGFTGHWSCKPKIFYRTRVFFTGPNQIKVFQTHLINKTQNIACFLYLGLVLKIKWTSVCQ